jgi:hypothetical protein
VSGVADRAPAAQNITSLFLMPRTFLGRERDVMRPFEITAGDFAFAPGHRRVSISFVAGTLKPLLPPFPRPHCPDGVVLRPSCYRIDGCGLGTEVNRTL